MHSVKGHDIIGFVSKRKGKVIPCMMSRGMTLGFVSKRKGEVIPCTMSRGMTGFLSERKG